MVGPRDAPANERSNKYVGVASSSEHLPTNVINLSEYVEKNIWKLIEKGHLKDLMEALNEEPPPDFLEDSFYVSLPIPANDELKPQDALGISLEDLVEAEDSDILARNYAWEQQELPDDPDAN